VFGEGWEYIGGVDDNLLRSFFQLFDLSLFLDAEESSRSRKTAQAKFGTSFSGGAKDVSERELAHLVQADYYLE
jgi:hypothetical protein